MIVKLLNHIPPMVCTLLTVALILWLTLAPHPVGETDIPLFPGADKIVHALMFGFLSWTAYIDLGKTRRHAPTAWGAVLCACASATLGALTEWLQGSMGAGRSMEGADLIADMAGASIACALTLLLRNKLPDLKY